MPKPKPKGRKPAATGSSATASSAPATAAAAGAAAGPPSPPTPAWPLFKQPAWQVLEPEALLDGRVVLVRNFWSRALCRDYVAFLRTLSLTTTPGRPKRGEATRVNDRFQVQDQAFADRLWTETGLRDVLLGEEWKASW